MKKNLLLARCVTCIPAYAPPTYELFTGSAHAIAVTGSDFINLSTLGDGGGKAR